MGDMSCFLSPTNSVNARKTMINDMQTETNNKQELHYSSNTHWPLACPIKCMHIWFGVT